VPFTQARFLAHHKSAIVWPLLKKLALDQEPSLLLTNPELKFHFTDGR
jgi:hypothetical protein